MVKREERREKREERMQNVRRLLGGLWDLVGAGKGCCVRGRVLRVGVCVCVCVRARFGSSSVHAPPPVPALAGARLERKTLVRNTPEEATLAELQGESWRGDKRECREPRGKSTRLEGGRRNVARQARAPVCGRGAARRQLNLGRGSLAQGGSPCQRGPTKLKVLARADGS